MGKKFGIDAFVESALANAEAKIRYKWPYLQKGDSPIEQMFIASLILRVQLDHEMVESVAWFYYIDDVTSVHISDETLRVFPQRTLIDWPIDFVIEMLTSDGKTETLAVECDGHEFHERTKEQAARDRARDRALQERGVTVFRFTGSELWRDPWACVSQVVQWAENAMVKGI